MYVCGYIDGVDKAFTYALFNAPFDSPHTNPPPPHTQRRCGGSTGSWPICCRTHPARASRRTSAATLRAGGSRRVRGWVKEGLSCGGVWVVLRSRHIQQSPPLSITHHPHHPIVNPRNSVQAPGGHGGAQDAGRPAHPRRHAGNPPRPGQEPRAGTCVRLCVCIFPFVVCWWVGGWLVWGACQWVMEVCSPTPARAARR